MSAAFDPTAPLTASGNLRRRRVVNLLAESIATGAALVAVVVLGVVIVSVAVRGAPALSLDFLTKAPPQFGGPGGGIGPAILGTAVIVLATTLMSVPLGVLLAIYVSELAGPRTVAVVRLALDLLNGLPSIVIGLFAFSLLVVGRHQSGFAGAVALAVIMVPLIARAAQEILLLVPHQLREAADALGVSRWRTIVGVVLPSALGGIVTGTVLAIARAAGETAPLMFTTSIFNNHASFDLFGQALPNIPVMIFILSEQPDPAGYQRAWGAGLVLLVFILVANAVARTLAARSRAKLGAR